jgi:microcystin-dependent protein
MSSSIPVISTGSILLYSGSTSPNEYYLLCDGRELSIYSYPTLFSVINITYGGSDISFNLPDLSGCFPIMSANEALNSKGGSQNATINALPSHTHNISNNSYTLSDHEHSIQSSFGGQSNYLSTSNISRNQYGGDPPPWERTNNANYNAQTVTLTDANLNTGSTFGNNNSSQDSIPTQNSYLTLNYIIKVLP